jgi:hypothetical protein
MQYLASSYAYLVTKIGMLRQRKLRNPRRRLPMKVMMKKKRLLLEITRMPISMNWSKKLWYSDNS